MATYKANGTKISRKAMKATIMRAHGWTNEQYRKQYDIFKNRLRAYESYKSAQGADVKSQSPQELLYRQAKAMMREGPNYEPSIEMKRIQSFSAVSITKGRQAAAREGSIYNQRRAAIFQRATDAAFAGFIRDVPKAQEIMATITNPVQREEALKALAEHIHAKQAPKGEVFSGETYGSDVAGEDFDFSDYIID